VHLINFCGGGQVFAPKSATAHTLDRCKQAETSHTNSTFGFLPTQKPTLKKPKELFFATARKKMKFYCHRTKHSFILLLTHKPNPKKMKECFRQSFMTAHF
jgi:hypothetical protein